MTDRTAWGAFEFAFDPSLEPINDRQGGSDAPDQEGLFLEDTEGRSEFLPPDPDRIPVIENTVQQDSAGYAKRPAEERTRELFGQMRPHRAALLGIIDAARSPLPTDEIKDCVEKRPGNKFSVYSPSNLCTMLEAAGALERVTASGDAYETCTPQPAIVVVDGEGYYTPTRPPKVHWRATEAGLTLVDEDDPLSRTRRLFEREDDLRAIHKRILTMASTAKGASIADLSAKVDGDPLISEPRRFYVQHFVEGLERCGALAWTGSAWIITETGDRALQLLESVIDNQEAIGSDIPHAAMPTETDGINW